MVVPVAAEQRTLELTIQSQHLVVVAVVALQGLHVGAEGAEQVDFLLAAEKARLATPPRLLLAGLAGLEDWLGRTMSSSTAMLEMAALAGHGVVLAGLGGKVITLA